MKITFVLPYAGLAGGIRVVAIYAERLRKRGHDVFVVSLPKKPITFKQKIKTLLKDKKWLAQEYGPSHFDDVDVKHKVIEKYRPVTDDDVPDSDVIIATWWETAEWVVSLSKSKGKKFYFIQHHEIHEGQPKERVRATYSLPLQKITISNWLVELMEKEYGDSCVSLVKNSVDTNLFYSPPRNKAIIPTVGMLYSNTRWKGCETSFKAFSIVSQRLPDARLIAFGTSEPSPGTLLPKNFEFILSPPQNEIKNIYSRCDVWLCGSVYEGFHLPPLEAMACRCPVVSTQVGGPVDIIKDKVNGYLVPVGDYKKLADAVLKVLSLQEREWRKMSENAYQTAQFYTWEDATDIFEKSLLNNVGR